MKINASPETIRGVAAALGLARMIDDRVGPADQGRIAAWSELVEPHKLAEDDLLDGIKAFYRANQKAQMIQVGDLIACSREVRRERNETEPEAAQTEREKRLAAKVKDDADAIGAAKAIPSEELKYRRNRNTPLSVSCAWCKARPFSRCTIPGTVEQLGDFHPSRYDAARVAS